MKLAIVFLLSFVSWAGVAPRIWFEPNQGQAHPAVQALVHTSRGYVYLGRNQMAVQVNGKPVRMSVERANGGSQAVLEEPLGAISSYFSGQTEKDWHTGIPHYARVRYKNVYPGIDLVYYAKGQDLEYDFRLQPNADPNAIRLAYNQTVRTDANGDLLVGGLRQKRPRVLQNGHEVACDYLVRDAHHVHLALGAYDRAEPLTVDPVLVFSSYLGGPGEDSGDSLAIDSSGFIYIGMSTESPSAPILDPFQQETIAILQPAVFKFTPDGQKIVYFTIFNSQSWDFVASLVVDANASPIIIGSTQSAHFPLKNPVQTVFNSMYWTGFVTKLSPDARSLVYSTYFGGSNWDLMFGVAVDKQGSAYITGWTLSKDFLVKNAIQPRYGGDEDCFIGKLSAVGDLVFSTYYGGSGGDHCFAITVAPDGNVLVDGDSNSSDYPFKNPIQTNFTPRGGYTTPTMLKLSPDGQTVIFATYFGGPTAGSAAGLAVDAAGNIYAAGSVGDNKFITKNAYQSTYPGAYAAFLAKFDPAMSLIYATYFGGTRGTSGARDVAVGNDGSVYLAGVAGSADFPQKNSLQTFLGGGPDNYDCFIAKFDPSGSLIYSTLLGGRGEDSISRIGLDAQGNVYGVGTTDSSDFPVHDAFQLTYGGGGDAFMFEISDNTPISPSPLTLSSGRVVFQFIQGGAAPGPQSFAVTGPAFAISASDPWIAVASPDEGTLNISVNTAGLTPRTYNGTVTLTPQAGTPAVVAVVLSVLAPAPVLAGITPALVGAGSNDTIITLHGSGFTSETTLLWDDTQWQATPVTFVDSTTLEVTFPKLYLAGQATYQLSVQNPQSAGSNTLLLTVGQLGPQFSASTVVNAASYAGGPVAPGEIVSIFGSNLVKDVSFDLIPATFVYYSPTQVNVTVPYQVSGQTSTQLVIGQLGISSAPVTLDVVPAAPGIFAAVPAGNNVVTLYATGCGMLNSDALPNCELPVSVTANGQAGEVLYAGIAPGLAEGVNQINFQLPENVTSGKISIVLTVGNTASLPFAMTLP
jgi:uncharacterized protein (TIGR03437 family)